MPSLVGKNVLRRSRCALCVIFVYCLYMKFCCKIGILTLENHQNNIHSHGRLYILASLEEV